MTRHSAIPARLGLCLVLSLGFLFSSSEIQAQLASRRPLQFQVSDPTERLEMIINTSRILTTEHNIPKLLVENESILRAQPIAPNQVQLSAVQTGFTNLTVWDEDNREYTVDVLVYGDARELENLLQTEFPDASLRVRPLATSVVISGYVPRADMVNRIIRMGEDYYPQVINNLTVAGVQQVLLHVKVMEVSRTKLRTLGFDWALFTSSDAVIQDVAGLVQNFTVVPGMSQISSTQGETLFAALSDGSTQFFSFLEALRQHNLVKVLAEPTLVTVSGRPASFSSGGEFPILVPQSLGTVSIEYREFGTRIDFVPIVLGDGRVRLEVRPQVSEIDPSRSVTISNTTVPGLRTRWADTAVEMNAGQTLALAGLIQNQVEAENRGLPWLADLPWVGAAFRRVQEQNNEIELLIMVTPEFVSALDPHEVPPCGPGQLTRSPDDVELYFRGYLEVPKCCADGTCASCQPGVVGAGYEMTEEISPGGEIDADYRTGEEPTPAVTPRRAPSLIGPIGYGR